MKNYKKIDYYKWCFLDGCYKYVASSNAHKTLRDAALHLPKQDKSGALVYTPRVDAAPPDINPTETINLWRVGYADSCRWYDAARLNLAYRKG